MIICHCHRVTAREAQAACSGPDADWRSVVKATRAATTCGGCVRSLRRAAEEALAERSADLSATGPAPMAAPSAAA